VNPSPRHHLQVASGIDRAVDLDHQACFLGKFTAQTGLETLARFRSAAGQFPLVAPVSAEQHLTGIVQAHSLDAQRRSHHGHGAIVISGTNQVPAEEVFDASPIPSGWR
jgi:hypothetical protein